jgi:hypothetical protein
MKRPYRLQKMLVDLEEVAAVGEIERRSSGMQVSFPLVLRSGFHAYATESGTEDGRRRLSKLREDIMEMLENH